MAVFKLAKVFNETIKKNNFANHFNDRTLSILYLISVVWGVLIFWISPHLPLIDLPQHAGQATLLKEMLLNQSKWSDIVTINYFTPNFATYVLVIFLMTFFKVSSALSVALSIAYCAFIYFSIQLRKHFKVDSRLDWLFLLPFFGFAYNWGFVTYLISAPIALLFLLLADKYAINPSKTRAVGLMFVGLLLLEAHGLMFLFTFCVGGLFLINHAKSLRKFMLAVIPYAFIFIVFTLLYKFNSGFNQMNGAKEYVSSSTPPIDWGLRVGRVKEVFIYIFAESTQNIPRSILYPIVAITVFAPWLFGLKINWNNRSAVIFLISTLSMILFFPNGILGTYIVYQRYSIFFLTSYALLFVNNQDYIKSSRFFSLILPNITLFLLIICTWVLLLFQTQVHWKFKLEAQVIDKIMSGLEPNQKMLYIINSKYKDGQSLNPRFEHYALWYQAEKSGFVEYNLASLAPFPVRYKKGAAAKFKFTEFGLRVADKSSFRYLIKRDDIEPIPKSNIEFFKDGACKAVIVNQIDNWTIYDNKRCMKK